MFDLKLSLTLFRRAKMQPASRMQALSVVLFSVVLFAVGCGDNGGDAVSASDEQSGKTQANPQRQETIPDRKPKIPEPQSIPGMNADAVLTTLLKPGLECWQPSDKDVLYLCSSEENENLTLLYEGEVAGRATGQVSSVEVTVSRRGAEGFEQHSQPFLSFLATQLKYRGVNEHQAYEFVNRNPSGGKATTTIGEATWIMSSSDDSKVLTITPA
jgi:hypothetical protein